MQIDAGYLFHWNNFNNDGYLDKISPAGSVNATGMTGVDLRFTLPTRLSYLNISIGAIIEKCWDEILSSRSDYILNGGGVYSGLSFRTKWKYFGFSSMMAIGVLSYKEYFYYYSVTPAPAIDIEKKKTSFGLGAMSSIGIYAGTGRFGINPQAQAVFSGGSSGSFLFYGFVLPVTIRF